MKPLKRVLEEKVQLGCEVKMVLNKELESCMEETNTDVVERNSTRSDG